jgi:lysophospholipid acyltransferase (LPLAT)-like uncharacterized protein
MKLRHRGLIGLAALLVSWLARVWLGTVRYRFRYWDGLQHPPDPRKGRNIYVIWHESLAVSTWFNGAISVLTSQHADGELVSRLIRHMGFRVIRGSTTRGGVSALLQMIKCADKTHIAITPDGPRGPRRVMQQGAVYLASMTGLPVIVVGVACDRAWRARSWDRMLIPKPWCTAYGVGSAPIHVPADLTREGMELYRQKLENVLIDVTEAAERLAGTKHEPRPQQAPQSTPALAA